MRDTLAHTVFDALAQAAIPPIVGLLLALLIIAAFFAGVPGASWETEETPTGSVAIGIIIATIVVATIAAQLF